MKWLINGVSRDLVSRVHLFVRTRACVRVLATAVSKLVYVPHCWL